MANTYHQIYIHAVFAVKFRHAVIEKPWQASLFSVIAQLIKETGSKPIIVNGVFDHVHCFIGLKPSVALSDVMKNAKAKSSKWINESGYLKNDFAWQDGYGAFSHSHNDVKSLYKYIFDQEAHHHHNTFIEEYTNLLNLFGIEYDDRYIFQDLL